MIREIDAKKLKALAGGTKSLSQIRHEQEGAGFRQTSENLDLLWLCSQDWDALENVRRDHERNVRYKNGDQWSDVVDDPDNPGETVREDVLISRHGKVPLKHNFIQQYLNNIQGQFLNSPQQTVVNARSRDDQPLGNMLTNTLQACHQLNRVGTLDINVLSELCLTGMACVKVRFDFWSTKNRTDGRLDIVNINRLFFNQDTEDPRLFDLRRIGELHDYSFDDLVRNFAKTKQDETVLHEIYGGCRERRVLEPLYANRAERLYNLNFFFTNDLSKYRVIEAWEKIGRWVLYVHDYADGTEDVFTDLTMADVEAINTQRLQTGMAAGLAEEDIKLIFAAPQYEHYWRVKYLTPNGYCLREMETPYTYEEHPYALATMPIIDGRCKAVLSDVIDIQRYINRLLTMLDFIIGSSAKGLLMVPEEAIPEGMNLHDFAREYVKVNGVVLIKKGAGDKLPKQIAMNSTNIGAWEMFNTEMQIMQKISGLSGAVQGQQARPGTPSSLYAQEAQNSLLNYLVLFDCFRDYCEARDEKLLKVLMQFIDAPRYIDINGKEYDQTARIYQPEMAKKIIDFNLTISKSMDTPVFRQVQDDMLMKLLEAGQIPLEVFLSNSSMPFADKLLNDIKILKEQASAGQVDPALLAKMRQQGEQNADPKAMAMMEQFMGDNRI